MESETDLAPWEIEEETEDERQARYKREAEEMKLKWDARRLEEKQSAERRVAFAKKEKERAEMYGPRDPIMEAYEDRMYEEARVIEVRRKQREVYERIKAFKLGRPLPPKGEPYVKLKPPPVEPPRPEEFDCSGWYDPQEDITAQLYKAPESYVSPTGPRPPERHLRGPPRAAWEDPPYGPPNPNARPGNWPKPGSLPARPRDQPVPSPTPQPRLPRQEVAKAAEEEEDKEVEEEEEELEVEAKGEEEEEEEEEEEVEEEEEEEEPPAANLPSAEEVKGMKVAQLKEALRKAGLPVAGTKAVLLGRLLKAIEG